MDDPTRTRISASAFPRLDKCPASLAKEREVNAFLDEKGVEYPRIDNYADTGDRVHNLIASVPLHHLRLDGRSPGKPFRELAKRSKDFGIKVKSPEFWFAFNALKARQSMTNFMVNRAMEEGGVERYSAKLDTERLFDEVPLEEGKSERISGVADFRLSMETKSGKTLQMIVDWKSGLGAQQDTEKDRQIHTLAHLGYVAEPDTTELFAAKYVASEQWEVPRLVRFDKDMLVRAGEQIGEITRRAAALDDRMRESASKPTEAVNRSIEKQANPGNHCMYCGGKVACRKLRQVVDKRREEEIAPALPEIRAGSAKIKTLKKKPAEEITEMEMDDLLQSAQSAQELVRDTGVIERYRKEAEAIVRSVAQKESIEGVEVKQGIAYPAVAAGADGHVPTAHETLDAIVDAVNTMKEDLDRDWFYEQLMDKGLSLKVGNVRDVIGEVLELSKHEVIPALSEATKGECPLTMEERAGKVVIDLQKRIDKSRSGEVSNQEKEEAVALSP